MSRILDEMRARYGSPRKAKTSVKARCGTGCEEGCSGITSARDRTGRSCQGREAFRPRSLPPVGLEWTSIEGVDVLRLAGKPDSNYVACPADRPSGTFEIYRLKPRSIVVRRIKKNHVLRQIERLLRRDEVDAERSERHRRDAAEGERVAAWRSEHQPGFYILPGEEDPGDRSKLIPIGPFWRFDSARSQYDKSDYEHEVWEDYVDDDVEEYASYYWASAQRDQDRKGDPRLMHVKIIEAPNRQAASLGQGHVWWEDGVFRGLPVDPRQVGWGW